jgi:hypothetical protein
MALHDITQSYNAVKNFQTEFHFKKIWLRGLNPKISARRAEMRR